MTSERPREATWRAHFPAQCPPHGLYFLTVKSTVLRRAPCLVSCLAVPLLKFLIIFEQRTPHFPFALGLAKYLVLSIAVNTPAVLVAWDTVTHLRS